MGRSTSQIETHVLESDIEEERRIAHLKQEASRLPTNSLILIHLIYTSTPVVGRFREVKENAIVIINGMKKTFNLSGVREFKPINILDLQDHLLDLISLRVRPDEVIRRIRSKIGI